MKAKNFGGRKISGDRKTETEESKRDGSFGSSSSSSSDGFYMRALLSDKLPSWPDMSSTELAYLHILEKNGRERER